MSEPFLAEIRIIGFTFAPRGWALCDGQVLPIDQNQSLYSLLGVAYGGDGRLTFALPDLRGRSPLHVGTDFKLGTRGGGEAHPLQEGEIPAHSHALNAQSDVADTPIPSGNRLAASSPNEVYRFGSAASTVPLAAGTVMTAGSGQGHENMQPFLALNFAIALQGLFPSRN